MRVTVIGLHILVLAISPAIIELTPRVQRQSILHSLLMVFLIINCRQFSMHLKNPSYPASTG